MELYFIKLNELQEIVFTEDLKFCKLYNIHRCVIMGDNDESWLKTDYHPVNNVDCKQLYYAEIAKAIRNNEHKILDIVRFLNIREICEELNTYVNNYVAQNGYIFDR